MNDYQETQQKTETNDNSEPTKDLNIQTNIQENPKPEEEKSEQSQQSSLEQNKVSNTPTNAVPEKKPRSKGLVNFLRFLVVGGGMFMVFIIGLGISFSACFTIKGPPPPECGPVSFVSLVLMPGAALLFLIPIARKIK